MTLCFWRRRVREVVAALAVALSAICAGSADAHPAPFSYLDIVFRDGGIEGTLVIHVIDAAHELSVTPADTLLDPTALAARRDALTAILGNRLDLEAGHRLLPVWTSVEPVREDMAIKLRFRIADEKPGALTIDTKLFPYDPQHQTFINIYERDALRQQLIFNAA